MNMLQEAIVLVSDLRKTYVDTTVVDDVSFVVGRGEVFGLLGPNGSRKTTTLEMIVGLRQPTSGSVTVLGLDPMRERAAFTEQVAVQPQAASLFPTLTVAETLELFASFYYEARSPEEILADIDLDDARNTRVKHLSGGQERRLLIGIALLGNPLVLVLDEPSAGLDPAAKRSLWEVIDRQREAGTTVLLSTHHMDEATQVCDRIAILRAGKIAVQGAPDDLVREHSSTATVTFTTHGDETPEHIRELGITGEITHSRSSAGTAFTVVTTDPDAVIRRLTFTPGLRASRFHVKHGSLEDLFLDLSQESESAPESDTT